MSFASNDQTDASSVDDLIRRIKPIIMSWIAAYPGPAAALDQSMLDADLAAGSVQTWLDVGSNTLRFKVKYPDGTIKSGQVTLS